MGRRVNSSLLLEPMPAPLRIVLSEESDFTLQELRVAPGVAQHIKDRAHMVRLNAQGWNVPNIAEIFECQEQTVRETLKRWEKGGLGGLWDAPGRGMKQRWSEADLRYLEERLERDQRTYNSAQLSVLLERERGVKLSADRIRRILQKRGSTGSAPATTNPTAQTQTISSANKPTSPR
jgi:transposase